MKNLILKDIKEAYDIKNNNDLDMLYWAYMFNYQHNISNLFEQNLSKEMSLLLSIDFHADIDTVAASLIYRTASKNNVPDDEIEEMFNKEVMKKVRILKSFGNDMILSDEDKELFIKSMLLDVKTTIIKLVERVALLHNISEKDCIDNNLLDDTLGFYVPIAQLLGIYKIKNNLEDLCFRYDENYEKTSEIVKKATERNGEIIEFVNDRFKNFDYPYKNDIEFKLNKKSNYDIYLKAQKINNNVDIFSNENDFKISGFCSIKCLTKTKQECYSMLAFIHEFGYQFGSFFDYISGFQGDEYSALHSNVFINYHLVDFRICTKEMNKRNLYGVTYGWENNPDIQNKLINNYKFYSELLNLVDSDLNRNILKSFKTDIIDKRVDVSDYKLIKKITK